MRNPFTFVRFILLIVATAPVVNADSFIWNRGRSMREQDRYLDGRIPCEDDNILVETGDDPTVLLLDDDLEVSSIYFQDNGVIYFGSKASIGDKKGAWQCDKNYGVEDAIVKKEPAPAFFDYENWKQMDLLGRPVRHPKIHAEKVPSSDDTAIFPSAKISPVTVGNQVRLSKLFYAGRPLTKQGFEDFLYTREGQQVFRLTNPLYAKNFTMASRNTAPYVFQCPDPEAFVIKKDDPPKEGQVQSTLNEIVFSEICSYVKCIDPTDYCDTPIRPVGHCCSICGTMATFSQIDFDYDAAQQALRDSEVERDNKTGFSLIRIQFAGSALYQLSVIPAEFEYFDADQYRHLLYEMYYIIQKVQKSPEQFQSTRIEVGFSQWKASSFGAKFLEFIIVAFIVCSVGAVMFKYELHKNPALRSFIHRHNTDFSEHLVRFRGNENVVLTLAGHEQVVGSEQSETFVNPVFEFDERQPVDSTKLQELSAEEDFNNVETIKNEI